MRYMLLIAGDPETGPAPDSPEGQAEFAGWMAYDQQVRDAGVYVSGEALLPPPTAKTVRVRGGDRLVSDGPFAETKEVLGGFYVVDVPDEAAALDWAARMPHVPAGGSVEVRPVMEFPDGS